MFGIDKGAEERLKTMNELLKNFKLGSREKTFYNPAFAAMVAFSSQVNTRENAIKYVQEMLLRFGL